MTEISSMETQISRIQMRNDQINYLSSHWVWLCSKIYSSFEGHKYCVAKDQFCYFVVYFYDLAVQLLINLMFQMFIARA